MDIAPWVNLAVVLPCYVQLCYKLSPHLGRDVQFSAMTDVDCCRQHGVATKGETPWLMV